MAGDNLSHADLTWYPTVIFMEFMLPRVFDWPKVFHETEHFPKLTKWFQNLNENPVFQQVHGEIWQFWVQKEKEGQFDSIRELVQSNKEYKWKYP